MTKEQNQVKEFMQTFGQETPDKPTLATEEIRMLRAKLVLEETLEFIQALGLTLRVVDGNDALDITDLVLNHTGKPDLVEVADALVDLHYVGYCGSGTAFGFDLEPIFKAVHDNNMTKLWSFEDVRKGLPVGAQATPLNNGRFLVKREDGKIIKAPSYQKVDLAPLVENQKKLV